VAFCTVRPAGAAASLVRGTVALPMRVASAVSVPVSVRSPSVASVREKGCAPASAAGTVALPHDLPGSYRAFLLTPDSFPRSAPADTVDFTRSDAQAAPLASACLPQYRT
jgi:hypothetical protein